MASVHDPGVGGVSSVGSTPGSVTPNKQEFTHPYRHKRKGPTMSPLLDPLLHLLGQRWQLLRQELHDNRDAGYTTETVVITAALVSLALVILAILIAKVTAKANSINL